MNKKFIFLLMFVNCLLFQSSAISAEVNLKNMYGYKQVFKFEAHTPKNSDTFIIRGKKFKIKYHCYGDMLNQVFLKKPDDEYFSGIIVNASQTDITDATIFYGAGEYYIQSNCDNCEIIIEDYRQ